MFHMMIDIENRMVVDDVFDYMEERNYRRDSKMFKRQQASLEEAERNEDDEED